jgi:transposase InsO family protein
MASFIKSDSPKGTKTFLAKKLGVSRSSLYYTHKQDDIDLEVKAQIEAVLLEHPAYGHKRLALHLKLNKKRMLRVMKKYGIKPYKRRLKKLLKKDDIGKPDAKIQNQVKYFCPIMLNIVWVSDFTYIKVKGKFIYFATIMDIYSREIIGISISRHHTSGLVLEALVGAITATGTTPKYLHSDQGSEYDSHTFKEFAKKEGITLSMSKKASPWENGHQESYYSGFKLDLGKIDQKAEEAEVIEKIYQTVYYYNNSRIHTKLKMSPVKFRANHESKIRLSKQQQSITISSHNPSQSKLKIDCRAF